MHVKRATVNGVLLSRNLLETAWDWCLKLMGGWACRGAEASLIPSNWSGWVQGSRLEAKTYQGMTPHFQVVSVFSACSLSSQLSLMLNHIDTLVFSLCLCLSATHFELASQYVTFIDEAFSKLFFMTWQVMSAGTVIINSSLQIQGWFSVLFILLYQIIHCLTGWLGKEMSRGTFRIRQVESLWRVHLMLL